MDFPMQKFGRETVISVSGRIDFTSSDSFKKALLETLDDSLSVLIIDMKNVESFVSTGIGVLISIKKTMKENNQKLFLANVPKDLRYLLNLASMEKLFNFFEEDLDAYIAKKKKQYPKKKTE